MSVRPTQIPTSLSFRSGTTTRDPTVMGFASPSSTAYVNVWKSGSGSATWTNRVAISRTLECRREIDAGRGRRAEPRAVGQVDRATMNGRAVVWIIGQQRRAVEIR